MKENEMDPITENDVFDLPHPHEAHRDPSAPCRWFATEFFTSDQGEKVATVRTIDGKHFATIAVAPKTYTVPDGDGVPRERVAPSLAQATNIERGGRAAAQARFDEHHALWLKRREARAAVHAAEEAGDGAAAARANVEAKRHDKAMRAHCDKTGLRLHHI
jgi:hypothetical protein